MYLVTPGKGWEIPVFLGGREERFDLTLDGTKTYLSTDGCGTRVIDSEARQERPSRKEDVARTARTVDALPWFSAHAFLGTFADSL